MTTTQLAHSSRARDARGAGAAVRDLPHDAELTLHVGVNSGHGIARILAARPASTTRCSATRHPRPAARVGRAARRAYVSEATMRLVEGEFEFEPVGELTLKGKAEPVLAWRLVGVRDDIERTEKRALDGRERELSLSTPQSPACRSSRSNPRHHGGGRRRKIENRPCRQTRGERGERGLASGSVSLVGQRAPVLAVSRSSSSLRGFAHAGASGRDTDTTCAETGRRRRRRDRSVLCPVARTSDQTRRLSALEPEAFRRASTRG